jgi:hypothetical protein
MGADPAIHAGPIKSKGPIILAFAQQLSDFREQPPVLLSPIYFVYVTEKAPILSD